MILPLSVGWVIGSKSGGDHLAGVSGQILCPQCRKQNLPHARFCQQCGHDMVLNNAAPSDERRYLITRVIKQGGQGALYEGRDQHGMIYAIKEMLDHFTEARERSEAIARFNDEAELLQRLNHPSIPRVYSHFRDEGRHYLTMDFIYGEDLDELLRREGRFDEARVLFWADQLCAVLDYLHGKGLIYRDMKPSNVMIERKHGDVKLVDFGITKLFKPTERGAQIGTPGYAPPEQYQGLATPQSDLYALGATLHHLLTGRDPTEQLPFSFPPVRHLVPEISQRTSEALERALQRSPHDRFATMYEFRAALRPAAGIRVVAPERGEGARIEVAAELGQATQRRGPPATRPPRARPGPRAAVSSVVSQLVRLILIITLLGGMLFVAYVYLERPAWVEPYLAPLLEPAP